MKIMYNLKKKKQNDFVLKIDKNVYVAHVKLELKTSSLTLLIQVASNKHDSDFLVALKEHKCDF